MAKILAVGFLCPENFTEDKLKNSALISLVEMSRKHNIESIA